MKQHRQGDGVDGEVIALASLLVGVRELAVRACARQLTALAPPPPAPEPVGWFARWTGRAPAPAAAPPDPLHARRAALQAGVHARMQAFTAGRGMPAAARDLTRWLNDLLAHDAPGDLPGALQDADLACVLRAWEHVTGQPLVDWVCDERLVAGEPLPATGVAALLTRMKGSDAPWEREASDRALRLPLAPLGADAILPRAPAPADPGYEALWQELLRAAAELPAVPVPDRGWTDSFDALLAVTLNAVPADAFQPDPLDSLVDVVRLVAACAIALRAHHLEPEQHGGETDPYRFVLGDFSPIQDFILGTDPNSPWPASAIAGGRSAFVKLASELAAHALLEELRLPSVCRMFTAASKFMLLVPHTRSVEQVLQAMRKRFDAWSQRELSGAGGIAIGWWMAGPDAVAMRRRPLQQNYGRSFDARYQAALASLEDSRLRRFRLLHAGVSPVLPGALERLGRARALCSVDGVSPARPAPPWLADALLGAGARRPPLSRASAFQLALAARLGELRQVLLRRLEPGAQQPQGDGFAFFGWWVRLQGDDAAAPAPGERAWDVAFATRADQRFRGLPVRLLAHHAGEAPREPLSVLKGDVDRLGMVFREGIPGFSLARLMLASRQLDLFFTLHVPRLLREHHPRVQTVLAGGDDFSFIGPLSDLLALARSLRRHWQAYTRNPSLTFSVGIALGSPHVALQETDRAAEDALVLAKRDRDAVAVHGRALRWQRWDALRALEQRLDAQLAALRPDERQKLLRRLHEIGASLDDPRAFTGLRWRSLVHGALHGCSGNDWPAFDALVQTVDRAGLAQFQADMLVPLRNLLLGVAQEGGAPPAPPPPTEPAAPAAPALDEVLATLDWAWPDAALFGERASELAQALLALPSARPLGTLLGDLREWDQYCEGSRNDRFAQLAARIAVSIHRQRGEGHDEAGAKLRRAVLERLASAEQLCCARWFMETVMTFHRICRQRRMAAPA